MTTEPLVVDRQEFIAITTVLRRLRGALDRLPPQEDEGDIAAMGDEIRCEMQAGESILTARTLSRMQELADGRANHGPCAHCGRNPAAGYARSGDAVVCHPDDPRLPDCYRRVTVYSEPLGALRDVAPKPAGVLGVQHIREQLLEHLGDEAAGRWMRSVSESLRGTSASRPA